MTRERWARIWTAAYALGTLVASFGWVGLRLGVRATWLQLPLGLVNLPVAPSLVSAVVCGLVTIALLRRKSIGLVAAGFWQVAGIYTGIAELVRLPRWERLDDWWNVRAVSWLFDVASVPLGIAILIHLWRIRRAFPARIKPGSVGRSALVLAVGLGASIAVPLLLLLALGLDPGLLVADAGAIVARTLGLGLGFGRAPDGVRAVPWLPELTSGLIAASLVAAVVAFLASARDPHDWSGEQELALRRLIALGDGDSLAYFATRRDKAAVFSPDRRAAITYRVVNGVCLASGDPIGARDAWRPAIRAWHAHAKAYGWLPGVLGASRDGARAYVESGFSALALGDEAVVDVGGFSADDRAVAPVLRAARHASASGVTVEIRRQGAIPADELAVWTGVAQAWRRGRVERGFSMALGRVADTADARVLVVTARLPDSTPCGLLTFVPWGRSGGSLDVMRRSPDAPNGVTDLMIAELLRAAPALGVARVSLNFCMFRRTFAESAELGSGPVTRLNHSVLGLLDRVWQLERLYRSNRRFQPTWAPRYLCYSDGLSLPHVALAVAAAEGFVGLPLRGRPRTPRLSAPQVALLAAADAPAAPGAGDVPAPERTSLRRGHADELRASGRDPYPPASLRPTADLAEVAGRVGRSVTVSGRLGAVRDHGGVVFADLWDAGVRAQVMVQRSAHGRAALREFARLTDRGDVLLVSGVTALTHTGTPTVELASWSVVAKCVRPLPGAGWRDPDARARHRSADLIVHPEGVDLLRARSAVVAAVRRTLDAAGFLEVETPILQAVHGGATARPFRTYANAAGMGVSLRIAPELYLKRLVVAGLGPLYELGRNFRNEGVDASHNPEFTAVEAYQPFADYDDMRVLTQTLVRAAATAVHGRDVLVLDGEEVDLSGDWPVVGVLDAVSDAVGEPVAGAGRERLAALATAHGVQVGEASGEGDLIEALYGHLVEPRTVRPTFYRDFPAETSPLARPHRSSPGLAERWDLVIGRRELGTAYTELTDPVEQRRRLTAQSLRAAGGDPEAMELDEDFLAALDLGMPPTGGLGLGIDRLVMVLTGEPIRRVLAFPLVRPERGGRRAGQARTTDKREVGHGPAR